MQDLKFSGPSAVWLELCRHALREWERQIGKYDVDESAVAEYINTWLTK